MTVGGPLDRVLLDGTAAIALLEPRSSRHHDIWAAVFPRVGFQVFLLKNTAHDVFQYLCDRLGTHAAQHHMASLRTLGVRFRQSTRQVVAAAQEVYGDEADRVRSGALFVKDRLSFVECLALAFCRQEGLRLLTVRSALKRYCPPCEPVGPPPRPRTSWDRFRDQIVHERRWAVDWAVCDMADPRTWLGNALRPLSTTLSTTSQLYRARLKTDGDSPLPPTEMGAPPPGHAVAGRASPAGVAVLYAALACETAVCELAPWPGTGISVATLQLRRDANVVDLRPGTLDESEDIWALGTAPMGFLEGFAQAMARPVNRLESPIDYLPTQYVAQVIREAGFDGMLYPSVWDGDLNVVLFEPALVAPHDSFLYRVDKIKISGRSTAQTSP